MDNQVATGSDTESEANSSTFWLELFFDLVAVAAMVVLATALEEHLAEHQTWPGLGLFSLTFAAIWTCWSAFVLYVNLASERAERRTVLIGMAAIAVMAAALLHLGEHANAFAIAFIVCRLSAESGTRRTRRILAGPVRLGLTTLPWIVSLWVPEPWKYLLWALGVLLDLGTLIGRRDAQEVVDRLNERARRVDGRADRAARVPATFQAQDLRVDHLTERLATFVIIVLGESVLQLVRAAAETPWEPAMWVAAAAAFVIIVGVWRQTFAYGFTGAPSAANSDRLGLTMLTHLVLTGSLVVLAASLGEFVRHADEPVERPWAWLAAGALAVYFAGALGNALINVLVGRGEGGPPARWIFGWSLPAIVAVLALATFGSDLHGWAFALLLMVPMSWQTAYLVAARARPGGRAAAGS